MAWQGSLLGSIDRAVGQPAKWVQQHLSASVSFKSGSQYCMCWLVFSTYLSTSITSGFATSFTQACLLLNIRCFTTDFKSASVCPSLHGMLVLASGTRESDSWNSWSVEKLWSSCWHGEMLRSKRWHGEMLRLKHWLSEMLWSKHWLGEMLQLQGRLGQGAGLVSRGLVMVCL